jgi:hypothetical protein
LTPECQWRAEDAKRALHAGPNEIPERTKPGVVTDVYGRLPPEVVSAKLKPQQKDIAACLHGKVAGPFLRVRFALDQKGTVTSVQTDYRVPTGEPERACASAAIEHIHFPAPEGGNVTVVYNAPTKSKSR